MVTQGLLSNVQNIQLIEMTSTLSTVDKIRDVLSNLSIKTNIIIESKFELVLLTKLDQLSSIQGSLPTYLIDALTKWKGAQIVYAYDSTMAEANMGTSLPPFNAIWLPDREIYHSSD